MNQHFTFNKDTDPTGVNDMQRRLILPLYPTGVDDVQRRLILPLYPTGINDVQRRLILPFYGFINKPFCLYTHAV